MSVKSIGAGPVFVVGIVRSGTSLLYSLLNQHPEVALMYECDVWDFPDLLSGPRFRNNWLERQEFYNGVLSRHRLVFGDSLRGLEQIRTPEQLYRSFTEGRSARVWGEKSPFYCARLARLAREYPAASFILLWRDPVEICRSVAQAGRWSRFFRRRGMLSRLIYSQEQMIRHAADFEKRGVRVHHVTYAGLLDQTETVCRGICDFLSLPFDLKMLNLDGADFSAIYQEEQHGYLRRGVVRRRVAPRHPLAPATLEKLGRFQNRWQRLTARWLGQPAPASNAGEPGVFERLHHRLAGRWFSLQDGAKRAIFEFLPLPWLQTYRQLKEWFLAGRAAPPPPAPDPGQFLAAHSITLLTSAAFLAGVGWLDYLTGPNLTLAPFYLAPAGALTLVLGRRWGTFAAVVSALFWTLVQVRFGSGFTHMGVIAWNCAMRFLLLQCSVLVLDRVRIEIRSSGREVDGVPAHRSQVAPARESAEPRRAAS